MAKFKTSARTVDMLGRQQIAGIPTAMSELFKNAYDAYATEVRADYFPRDSLLVLRDNGIGMSETDFLERWLTLGTDSKTVGGTLAKLNVPAGAKRRQQMGEKGIGRLAIASIAPLVMVMTRAMARDAPADSMTAALVPWSLFETPGLTLDEIDIPVISDVSPVDDLSVLLTELVRRLNNTAAELGDKLGPARVERIREQGAAATKTKLSRIPGLDGPQVATASGTTFVLFGTGDDLEAAVSVDDADEQVSEFQRFLGGFTNTITRPVNDAPIQTRFVVHRGDGVDQNLIGAESFWKQSDFDAVDHVISGEFDSSGSFSGTVRLYRGDSIEYPLGWGIASRDPKCGPFKFTLGILQGNARESRLPADEFVIMSRRLRAQGGLYIYRDDIRVLPYGNSDVDYLGIEERRSKNAGRYYFSHRRIFGAVELTAERNPGLQEKAGREGFRQNGAYRDFVAILEHFLQQVATDFFRVGGEHSDEFASQRDILTSRAKARAEKEKREAEQRERYAARVDEITEAIQSGAYEEEVGRVRARVLERQASLVANDAPKERWDELLAELRRSERDIADRLDLRRPASLALTSNQERDYDAATVLIRGTQELVRQTVDELTGVIIESASAHNDAISVEPSGRDYLSDYVADGLSEALQEGEEARDAVRQVSSRLVEELSSITAAVTASISEIVDSERNRAFDVARLREKERRVDEVIENARVRVHGIRETTEHVFFDPDVMLDNRQLQERVLDLEDEADNNVELMQLGLAVQLVNHELENNIAAVRTGLRRLQPWARANPRLNVIVQDVRSAFQHLDGYLRMFTPLQRRLYRRRIAFSGADLVRFSRGVFDERLKRHEVTLVATDEFNRFELFGYPSSYYPVFLNLIDNAIFWTQQSEHERVVRLDANGDQLLVLDSGPGIRPQDKAAIFQRGFSRRRGGRGLGLALASEILAREGWKLTVEDVAGPLGGAVFGIRGELGDADG